MPGTSNFEPNIAVAGCGHWGKNLIRNMSRLGCLAGVFDVATSRAEELAAAHGVKAYATLEALLDNPAIRALVIATPAEMHTPIALAAIAAGKDVFVEKPLALSSRDGAEIDEAARKAGRLLMVGHLLLYHPAVVRVRELLCSGELGKLEYIYSNRVSMGKIRREENALWSFAPHDISVTLALVGETPIEVSAVGASYVQPPVADVTVSNLRFAHGVRAHIFVSWLHPYKEQRLVVIGSRNMVVFEDTRPIDKLLIYNKDIDVHGCDIKVTKPAARRVEFDSTEPLLAECAHFAECVRDRKAPLTNGLSGVDVLRVLDACQQSIQCNGTPVPLGGRR